MTPEQLKNSILQLAIEGKLVEQRKEEYVSTALFNAKKNTDMEILGFEIPNNWELSTIEGIANIISTKKYQIRESEILKDGLHPVISQSKEIVIGYSNDKNKLLAIKKPVIIFGDHTTVVKYIDFDFVVGADGIKIFDPISDINPKFFKYSIDFLSIGLEKKGGYSRHYKFIKNLSMPVPPLAEQKRIVEKIEELLPLVDRYEKAWSRLEELNKKFPFDMQKSILQEAIQGKLVEQRKEEGTGEELFEEIQKYEDSLIRNNSIKKEKPFPSIEDNEYLFDIPDNWIWVRFGELGRYKKGPFGSALTKNIFVPKGDNTIKVYEQKNAIKKDASIGEYYITKSYFTNKLSGFSVEPGDIIVSCAGTIGEAFILPSNIEKGIINQALMRMRLFEPIFVEYFLLYFDYVLKKNARGNSKGSAIKNIPPFAILKNYLVPLPPLAEQKRIVEKIEELLPLCEKLK